ncbi:MAG: CCA tRNA nucleotidyltransferase [Eubacterium sp.]|nr:CCA tRNA nucleotidyltransferase [Eubacterium sp.]
MSMNMPQGARQIIETLENHGYEAYIVGGCVRDMLLNDLHRNSGLPERIPGDWDITTSAKPEEVKKLFRRTVDTGIQHGTVTVLMRDGQYEVTTYRLDGNYEDHRHPDEVVFTPELSEDLKRRDFTINAMAYSERDGLIDLFGGEQDLEDGIIRCVGNPMERFNEDALRMLRGIRFAGQLGFSIERETFDAIKSLASTIVHVSAERIRVELTKLLISDSWPVSAEGQRIVRDAVIRQPVGAEELSIGPGKLRLAYEAGLTPYFLPEFDEMMKCEQNNPHHCYNVGDHTLSVIGEVNRVISELTSDSSKAESGSSGSIDKKTHIALAFAALLHDVAKPVCRTTDSAGIDHYHGHDVRGEEMAGEILRRLKFDNDTIALVKCLVRNHDVRYTYCVEQDNPVKGMRAMRRLTGRVGRDRMPLLFLLQRADIYAQSDYKKQEKYETLAAGEKCFQAICEAEDAVTISELAISGRDLIDEFGYEPGPAIGAELKRLLELVLDDPSLNTREKLFSLVDKNAVNQK